MRVIMSLWKNKEKHSKRRLKVKTVSVTHPNGGHVRISNYVKIIDNQHVHFNPPRGLRNSLMYGK